MILFFICIIRKLKSKTKISDINFLTGGESTSEGEDTNYGFDDDDDNATQSNNAAHKEMKVTLKDVNIAFINTLKSFQDAIALSAAKSEEHAFGTVVADMMKQLNPENKAEAKAYIIQYLTDIQLQQL